MEMEGKEYMAPVKWESYLLHLFGEHYMELPPEDKRKTHPISRLRLPEA